MAQWGQLVGQFWIVGTLGFTVSHEHIKTQATDTLAAVGLTVSDAARVFLTRVVADQQLPFELKSPNAATKPAMREARKVGDARFATPKPLIDDLDKGAKQ